MSEYNLNKNYKTYAEKATQKISTGSISFSNGSYTLTIPDNINVIKVVFTLTNSRSEGIYTKYVGVTPGKSYKFKSWFEDYHYGDEGDAGTLYYAGCDTDNIHTTDIRDRWIYNGNDNFGAWVEMINEGEGTVTISWSPEINNITPEGKDYH